MRTREIKSDIRGLVREIFNEQIFYFQEHPAKVKEITESGSEKSFIRVYSESWTPGADETDQTNWRTAIPGSIFYSNLTPEIEDTVLIYFPERTPDLVYYKAMDPISYVFKKLGSGFKVLFEYEENSNLTAIYFDKINEKMVFEFGSNDFQIRVGPSSSKSITINENGMSVADRMDVTFQPSGRSASKDGFMTPLGPTISRIPGLHP